MTISNNYSLNQKQNPSIVSNIDFKSISSQMTSLNDEIVNQILSSIAALEQQIGRVFPNKDSAYQEALGKAVWSTFLSHTSSLSPDEKKNIHEQLLSKSGLYKYTVVNQDPAVVAQYLQTQGATVKSDEPRNTYNSPVRTQPTHSTPNNSASIQDVNNDGIISGAEAISSKQSAPAIASDIVSSYSVSNSDVLMLGEAHNGRPTEIAIETLKAMRAKYPDDVLSFGIELNSDQFTISRDIIGNYSSRDLAQMSTSNKNNAISKVARAMERDYVAASLAHYPQYLNANDLQKESLISSTLQANNEAIQSLNFDDMARILIEAKSLGYELYGFDEKTASNAILSTGSSMEDLRTRENFIADNISCRVLGDDKNNKKHRTVVLIGQAHAVDDGKLSANMLNQAARVNVSADISAKEIIEDKGFNVFSAVILNSQNRDFNDRMAQFYPVSQFDKIYSF